PHGHRRSPRRGPGFRADRPPPLGRLASGRGAASFGTRGFRATRAHGIARVADAGIRPATARGGSTSPKRGLPARRADRSPTLGPAGGRHGGASLVDGPPRRRRTTGPEPARWHSRHGAR